MSCDGTVSGTNILLNFGAFSSLLKTLAPYIWLESILAYKRQHLSGAMPPCKDCMAILSIHSLVYQRCNVIKVFLARLFFSHGGVNVFHFACVDDINLLSHNLDVNRVFA